MDRVRESGQRLGRHGTTVSYDSGCRCEECRESHNAKSRAYKERQRARDRLSS